MISKQIEILLVEDDPGDVDLTRGALKDEKLSVNLNVVGDGVKALKYLRNEGSFADAIRPDLIILDLNLPQKDGREVLREIKNDKSLKHIPVVVLTTSDQESDILKSYGLGANCYIAKPMGFDQFKNVVKAIEGFWFTIVKLPPRQIK